MLYAELCGGVLREFGSFDCTIDEENAIEVIHLVLEDTCLEILRFSRYEFPIYVERANGDRLRSTDEADDTGNRETSLGIDRRADRATRHFGIRVHTGGSPFTNDDDPIGDSDLDRCNAHAILLTHRGHELINEPVIPKTRERRAINLRRSLTESWIRIRKDGERSVHGATV